MTDPALDEAHEVLMKRYQEALDKHRYWMEMCHDLERVMTIIQAANDEKETSP